MKSLETRRRMSRGKQPVPAHIRVLRQTLLDDGCWEFTGRSRSSNGYGLIRVGSRVDGSMTKQYAHRVLYEAMRGPIPDGMEMDHLCFNVACVNPDHLEPVTHAENVRRQRRCQERKEAR